MNGLIVIPARYASGRFPGKPLAEIAGKPMIQHVFERASRARGFAGVCVATDDARIENAVRAFGGKVIMTSVDLPSGTDRVAAVADQILADFYVNVQGDEPLIEPAAIEACARLITEQGYEMATLMAPLVSAEDLENRNVVKVVADARQRAIYFSRFPIPYSRQAAEGPPYVCRKHLGLYAYRRDTLFRLRSLPVSGLEQGESLEQLRALESGISIGISQVEFESIGVDTPQDLERVRGILKTRG